MKKLFTVFNFLLVSVFDALASLMMFGRTFSIALKFFHDGDVRSDNHDIFSNENDACCVTIGVQSTLGLKYYFS